MLSIEESRACNLTVSKNVFSIDFLSGLLFTLSWWSEWEMRLVTMQVALSHHKSGLNALGNVMENNSLPTKWSYSIDLLSLSRFYDRVKSWILVCTLFSNEFCAWRVFHDKSLLWWWRSQSGMSRVPSRFVGRLHIYAFTHCKTRNKSGKIGFIWGHSKAFARPKMFWDELHKFQWFSVSHFECRDFNLIHDLTFQAIL